MTNDNFDDLFDDAARSYNAPPDTPREAMWAAIARARDDRSVVSIATPLAARRSRQWIITAAAIAAVLVIGIAIGRASRAPSAALVASSQHTTPAVTTPPPSDTQAPSPGENNVATPSEAGAEPSPARGAMMRTREQRVAAATQPRTVDVSGDESAYRLAVMEHFTRTEVLLTGFRAQSRGSADTKMDAQFATLSRDLLATTRLLLTRRGEDPTMVRLLQDLELVLMQLSQYATDGRRADLDAVNQSIEKRNVLPKLRSSIPAGTALSSGT